MSEQVHDETAAASPETDGAEARHEREIKIHVNERPVVLDKHRETGLRIKEAAIAQGVPIQPDFILVKELDHGRTKVIGDDEHVEIKHGERFLANDGDDNS